jgi:hypothetical protein
MDDRLGASLAPLSVGFAPSLDERMTPPRCALRSVQRRCRAPPIGLRCLLHLLHAQNFDQGR